MSGPDDTGVTPEVDAVLADPITWSEPGEEMVQSLMAEIAHLGEETRPQDSRVAGKRTGRSVRAWIGAVAAVALLAVVWSQAGQEPLSGDDAFALQAAADGVGATARAGPAAAGWWIQLDAPGLPGAPEGSFYEGWAHDDTTWISLGTFHMREPGPVTLWSGVSLQDYSRLVVTLEAIDGDPAPSHEVVLEGTIPADVAGG